MYVNGLPGNEIKAFFSLKLLISNIQENGIFFSVACNEANNENLMFELAAFTSRNIKIFTNSNFSTIEDLGYIDYSYSTLKVRIFNSILNSFLTGKKWIRDTGWKYYDTKLKKVIITNKDLWLYSNNSKLYELISRKRSLDEQQNKEEFEAQLLFSKKFKEKYIVSLGEASFKKYKLERENLFPRFKS